MNEFGLIEAGSESNDSRQVTRWLHITFHCTSFSSIKRHDYAYESEEDQRFNNKRMLMVQKLRRTVFNEQH